MAFVFSIFTCIKILSLKIQIRMGRVLNKIASMVPSGIKKKVRKVLYNQFARVTIKFNENSHFINLGYATSEKMILLDKDEPYRLHIQLYHELIKQVSIEDKNVLEIGCGFGGGCYYMAKYNKPASVTGIDLSDKNISICRTSFNAAILKFYEMDAENTTFADETFDVIVNLESSHSYPSRNTKFSAEVVRLLKPGGYFAYGDLFPEEKFLSFSTSLINKGMIKLSEREITQSVMESRKSLSKSLDIVYKPFWMPASMYKDFMVTTDSITYIRMARRELLYKLFVFKKD